MPGIYKNGNWYGAGGGGSTIQVDQLPAASQSEVGNVYQYIGSTTPTYKHNYFYECVNQSGTYSWKQVFVQPNYTVANEAALIVPGTFTDPFLGMIVVTLDTDMLYILNGADPTVAANWQKAGTLVDSALSTTSENPVQNKVITGAIGDLSDLDTTATDLVGAVNETLEKSGTPISQSDFDQLSQSEKDNGTAWYIYDAPGLTPSLSNTGFTPVGTIISVMGTTAPNHYLPCNGQVVNIADYPELAHYFEVQFNNVKKFGGDGLTTFGIPDLRGEFLRGTGTNSHTNQGSGANVGTHQDSTAIPKSYTNTNGTEANIISNSATQAEQKNIDSDYALANGTLKWAHMTATAANTGNTKDVFTVRPTNTSVLYCIATKNIYIDVRYQYSTDEMVIGNWLDGKPVYQVTIAPTTTYGQGTFVLEAGFGSNHSIDVVVSMLSHYRLSTDYFTQPLPFGTSDYVRINNNGDLIYVKANTTGKWFVITTIQYTKTTD